MTLETGTFIVFFVVPFIAFILTLGFGWIADLINNGEPLKAKEYRLLKYVKPVHNYSCHSYMMLKADGHWCYIPNHPKNDERIKNIIADGGRFCWSSGDTFCLDDGTDHDT